MNGARLMTVPRAAALVAMVMLVVTRPASAEPRPRAAFALIIGANTSVDADLTPLHYADDDAARYFDLFRLLGMRTVLLARVDDSTRKLHPQAAAEAWLPRRADFDRATTELAREVAQARQRGMQTTLYFVFAGHGGVDGGHGYIALEDARVGGDVLARDVVARIDAEAVHMILDACDSYLVAYSRGPGGERRPVRDFVPAAYELGRDPRVGLLLSTSSAAESHEWDAFQAGVFSHEVRSGLYGAADADGDGTVSYREIAAFVARANESIENDRFRPHVFARPAAAGGALLDLRPAQGRSVTVDGAHAGHYLLEDARGVRLADFHNSTRQSAVIVRPAPNGQSYLRRLDDDLEFTIPPGDGSLSLADISPQPPRVASRGALHESFSRLFSLPFDRAAVDAYVPPAPPPEPDTVARTSSRLPVRAIAGWSLVGAGAVGVGLGAYFAVRASGEPAAAPSDPQMDVAARNARVTSENRAALWSFVAGGAAAAGGIVLLLWPSGGSVRASAFRDGAFVSYGGAF